MFQMLNVNQKLGNRKVAVFLENCFRVPFVVIVAIIDIAEPAMTMKRLEICIALKNILGIRYGTYHMAYKSFLHWNYTYREMNH